MKLTMANKDIKQFIDDKNYDSALQLLDQDIQEDPSNKKLKFTKAEILFQKKQFQEAFKIINEITEFGSPVTHWVLKAKYVNNYHNFKHLLIVTMK